MIERKTVIDQIEVTRTGEVRIRFGLVLIEDGVEIDCKWHRTAVEPGINPDDQIAAVNAHLKLMGKPTVDPDMLPILKTVVSAVHTPGVVKAHRARVEAATKEADATLLRA